MNGAVYAGRGLDDARRIVKGRRGGRHGPAEEPLTRGTGHRACSGPCHLPGDSWANCDESTGEPVLNVGDFVCFMERFAGGCE
jgi:hypothetical protein